jgi:hypothetical protein
MATTNSANINIKVSVVIVGIAMLLLSLLAWSLSTHYENIIGQLKGQWQKIGKLEKVICAKHPAKCSDL